MIAIVNIDPNPRPFGEHIYSLRINQREILQFRHLRERGLAECLRAAWAAVERQKWEGLQQEFDKILKQNEGEI